MLNVNFTENLFFLVLATEASKCLPNCGERENKSSHLWTFANHLRIRRHVSK
jgi:hypothetical protein